MVPYNLLGFGLGGSNSSGRTQAISGFHPQPDDPNCTREHLGYPNEITTKQVAPVVPAMGSYIQGPFAFLPQENDTLMTNNTSNTPANQPATESEQSQAISTITQEHATYPQNPFGDDHRDIENFMASNPFNSSHKESAVGLHPTLKRSRSAANIDASELGSTYTRTIPPSGYFTTNIEPRPVGRPPKHRHVDELSHSRVDEASNPSCDELLQDPDNLRRFKDSHSGLVRPCTNAAAHQNIAHKGKYHVCEECINRGHELIVKLRSELPRPAMLPVCVACTTQVQNMYPDVVTGSWSTCRCPLVNVVADGAKTEGPWLCCKCRVKILENVQRKKGEEEEWRRGIVRANYVKVPLTFEEEFDQGVLGMGHIKDVVATVDLEMLCWCGKPLGGVQAGPDGTTVSVFRCAGCKGHELYRAQ